MHAIIVNLTGGFYVTSLTWETFLRLLDPWGLVGNQLCIFSTYV